MSFLIESLFAPYIGCLFKSSLSSRYSDIKKNKVYNSYNYGPVTNKHIHIITKLESIWIKDNIMCL